MWGLLLGSSMLCGRDFTADEDIITEIPLELHELVCVGCACLMVPSNFSSEEGSVGSVMTHHAG